MQWPNVNGPLLAGMLNVYSIVSPSPLTTYDPNVLNLGNRKFQTKHRHDRRDVFATDESRILCRKTKNAKQLLGISLFVPCLADGTPTTSGEAWRYAHQRVLEVGATTSCCISYNPTQEYDGRLLLFWDHDIRNEDVLYAHHILVYCEGEEEYECFERVAMCKNEGWAPCTFRAAAQDEEIDLPDIGNPYVINASCLLEDVIEDNLLPPTFVSKRPSTNTLWRLRKMSGPFRLCGPVHCWVCCFMEIWMDWDG